MKQLSLFLLLIISLSSRAADTLRVKVTNDTDVPRQELVAVDYATVAKRLHLQGKDSLRALLIDGHTVDWQLTHDGQLLLDAAVRPHATTTLLLTKGRPYHSRPWVFGRQYPDRKDDISFENDRIGYRIYGPASEQSGDNLYGYDVWVKNTPELMLERFYAADHSIYTTNDSLRRLGLPDRFDSLVTERSYHRDHGRGHDPYAVGPTLGAGCPALMVDGRLQMPRCYTSYDILDNGPLRFALLLHFAPCAIGKDKKVTEHRLITLDKGSNFCRTEVWYDGLSKSTPLAMGIVVHTADTTCISVKPDAVLYADPTDRPDVNACQVFLGLLFPEQPTITTSYLCDSTISPAVSGHLVGQTTVSAGQHTTYYFGSAWSKADVRSFAEWQLRASQALDALRHPLSVSVK